MAKRADALKDRSRWDGKLPIILAGGAAAVGCGASRSTAAVTYDPLNLTIDSAGTPSAIINFPAIGTSFDNYAAFKFTASTVNGIDIEKPQNPPSAYTVNTSANNQTAVGSLTAFPALALISSASATASPATSPNVGQILVTADGTGGHFTESAGLQYVGFEYGSGSTAHFGWIGFQTLDTTSDPAGDVKGLITGIALEGTAGLPIQAGSTTTTANPPATLSFSGAAGNGAWDLSTANWNNGTGTVAYHDLDNVTLNDAANTGGQYNLTLSATGTTAVPGALSPSSFAVNTNNTYTLNGVGVAGSTTLVKSGTGSLILNNQNNYRGVTSINQGNVTLTTNGAILSSTTVAVGVAGGTSATLTFQPASSGGILLRKLISTLNVNNGLATVAAATGPGLIQPYRTVLSVGQMSINTTSGLLNLNNNDLIYRGSSDTLSATNLKNLTGYLSAGLDAANGGYWNGSTGIISTSASKDTTHLTAIGSMRNTADGSDPIYTTFDGQTLNLYDVLLKYTYVGDANLDGIVDGSDYSLIDNGFLQQLTGWYNGDFNYDGVVDGSDYTLIDNAYNQQGAALTSIVAETTSQITPTTAVPEPASLALLAMGAVGIVSYRRRSAAL